MTIQELNRKDVIQEKTGENLGRIDDISFDTATAQIQSVILRGRSRLFGLLGKDDDLEIPWKDIRTIGVDVVMVETQPVMHASRSKGVFC